MQGTISKNIFVREVVHGADFPYLVVRVSDRLQRLDRHVLGDRQTDGEGRVQRRRRGASLRSEKTGQLLDVVGGVYDSEQAAPLAAGRL